MNRAEFWRGYAYAADIGEVANVGEVAVFERFDDLRLACRVGEYGRGQRSAVQFLSGCLWRHWNIYVRAAGRQQRPVDVVDRYGRV